MNNLLQQLIGKEFKRLRKSDSLSQMAFCEKAGINYRHYQDLEAGKKNFKIDTLYKIAKFYELNPFSFFLRMFINNSGKPSLISREGDQACIVEFDDSDKIVSVYGRCLVFNNSMIGFELMSIIDGHVKVAVKNLKEVYVKTNGAAFGTILKIKLNDQEHTIYLKLEKVSGLNQLQVNRI